MFQKLQEEERKEAEDVGEHSKALLPLCSGG